MIFATLRITSMPTYRALRRTGDQPSHLSDRALSLIAPHSKHAIMLMLASLP
jgi:hypothetical protein